LNSSEVVIEFSRDILHKFVCPSCQAEEEKFLPLASVRLEAAKCAMDGQLRRVETLHSYCGEPHLRDKSLDQLGLPLLDVFVARSHGRELGYIPFGDAKQVLGDVEDGAE
jgi:hypothetical protein